MGVHLNPFTSQLDIVDSPSGDFSDLTLSAGTAAAPSISFTGDPNTGLYSPGADQVAISTNGTGRLFVDASGNVGLGTSSPGALLSLYAGADSEYFRCGGNGATARDLVFSATTGTNAGDTHTLNASSSTGQLILSTASTPRMLINSSGNVGIGTTTPSTPLHITSSSAGGLVNITSTSTSAALVFNDSGTGANYPKIGSEGSNLVLRGGAVSNAAYIDASGRLLVSTSSTVSIAGSSAFIQHHGNKSTANIGIAGYANNLGGPILAFGASRSTTVGTPGTIVSSGDILGDIRFAGDDGTDINTSAASIRGEVDGTPGSEDMPGRLVFSTTADGASSPTERMRITSGGRVVVGLGILVSSATSSYILAGASSTPTGNLAFESVTGSTSLRYHQAFTNPNGVVGTITTSASATAYNTSSDYRLKENVTPVTDGITRVQQLKPSRFNFIADPDTVVDGFIAHEVQTIVPEAITGEKDAVDDEGNPVYQGIDQSKLVPLLTAALQEAIGRIETLEAEVAALKAS